MAAVAAAVNELYGSPLDAGALVRLLVDNHGEEIGGADDVLLPVQAIGGSAAAGLVKGAVQVVAGDAVPILRGDLAGDYEVVLAVPRDLRSWDAAESLEAEAAHFDGFRRTGEVHGRDIAYRLLHNAWPALVTGSLRELGELVYDYRFHMGSIANCGFSHPRLAEIADSLTTVFESGAADVLSLSSVGPLFFAVTRNPAAVEGHFGAADLVTFRARPWSHGYVVEAE
jgi:predicted sugar kinase